MNKASLSLPIALLLVSAGSAFAEDMKEDDPTKFYLDLSAHAGLVLTTGNSDGSNLTLGAQMSLKKHNDKVSFETGLAYAHANVLTAHDFNGNGTIDNSTELSRVDTTTTNQYFTKLRYDRFLSEDDALFAGAGESSDEVAGKDLVVDVNVGYSRHLYRDDDQDLSVEIGYDFSYENYVNAVDSVAIHSARLFVGDKLRCSDTLALFANAELLLNLNSEDKALSAGPNDTATTGIAAFKDTRINAKAGFTTKLWKNISLSVTESLRYDSKPPPLPAPSGTTFAAGFVPFAEKLDTLTEVALVVSVL
jgi:hypothetical protein